MRIEGNDDQVTEFKDFIEDQVQGNVQLSGIILEEYTGHVPTIKTFLASCTTELLDRWIREYKHAEKMNAIL